MDLWEEYDPIMFMFMRRNLIKYVFFMNACFILIFLQNGKVLHFNLNILVAFESFCFATCYGKLKAFPSTDQQLSSV